MGEAEGVSYKVIDWTYTATHKQHRTNYDIVGAEYRWTIKSCVECEYRSIHNRKDGYDLYHRGKKIAHGKTVKELKLKAETIRD